ncbi:MAG: T9SS type A sorting domain-containing protein [bacterium]
MKKNLVIILFSAVCLILSGWGYKGHRKINQNTAANFPGKMAFLNPGWTNTIVLFASEADNRKQTDPNESWRHYIDIDNYPEFVATGKISQSYDSLVLEHGGNWVLNQGILPWATIKTYDSLKACFERGDWIKSALFAADLGHYVADGNQPLHITRNYDGQYTGNDGIHSRFESKIVSRYESLLVCPVDSVQFIGDVRNYVFTYIYQNYKLVDSIMYADSLAQATAGNYTSDAYYQALWSKCGNYTIGLFHNSTRSLADLIYTAWVQAGSPVFYPNAIEETAGLNSTRLMQNYPNPVVNSTLIPIEVARNNTFVSLRIYDAIGNLKATLLNENMKEGYTEIRWDASEMPDGIYYCVLKSDDWTSTRKVVVMK